MEDINYVQALHTIKDELIKVRDKYQVKAIKEREKVDAVFIIVKGEKCYTERGAIMSAYIESSLIVHGTRLDEFDDVELTLKNGNKIVGMIEDINAEEDMVTIAGEYGSEFVSPSEINGYRMVKIMRCEMVNLELLEYKCTLLARKELKVPNANIQLVKVFPQMWGGTALGLDGWGGSAMTTALTTVFRCGNNYIVFFGNRSAYCVSGEKSIELFVEDLKKERLPSVSKAKERYKEG